MRNRDILVSVVIPTYSRNLTLERAIDSVLNQTYENIEIIVVDDNPADSEWRISTAKLMEKFAENEKVIYIQNVQNLGGSGARNEGIKRAKGEYVAFLDDDDEYLPEKIEKQLELFVKLNNPNLALVYCYSKFINEDGTSTFSKRKYYSGNCLYEAMVANCIAATSQWMVKKEAVESVGMFTVVPCKQDSQLILKLLSAGYEIDCVEEELSLYYNFVIGDRISRGNMKNIQGEKLYIAECRKQYHKLETWQIINIEYAFARRFHELYCQNRMKKELREERRIMYQLKFLKTVKYLMYIKLRCLKNILKERIRTH